MGKSLKFSSALGSVFQETDAESRILEVIYSGGDPEKHQNRSREMKQERKKVNKERVNGWHCG